MSLFPLSPSVITCRAAFSGSSIQFGRFADHSAGVLPFALAFFGWSWPFYSCGQNGKATAIFNAIKVNLKYANYGSFEICADCRL